MNKYLLRNIILIAASLTVSAALFIAYYSGKTAGKSFEITVNGELYGTYPLDTDTMVDVNGLCTVEVKGGCVSVTESACKGKDCVHHKPISSSGERIVCLPNGIVIRVLGEGVDFVL